MAARPSMLLLLPLLALVLPLLALALPAPTAACVGGCTPIHLVLTYQPGGLSNWGPETATGVAEVIMAEGEVRGRVTGLPRLAADNYRVWLVDTRTDQAVPFGNFNTDDQQRGQFRFILPEEIPDGSWNLLQLSVEPIAGQPTAPPRTRRSIAGLLPTPDQLRLFPNELPNTGAAQFPPFPTELPNINATDLPAANATTRPGPLSPPTTTPAASTTTPGAATLPDLTLPLSLAAAALLGGLIGWRLARRPAP